MIRQGPSASWASGIEAFTGQCKRLAHTTSASHQGFSEGGILPDFSWPVIEKKQKQNGSSNFKEIAAVLAYRVKITKASITPQTDPYAESSVHDRGP